MSIIPHTVVLQNPLRTKAVESYFSMQTTETLNQLPKQLVSICVPILNEAPNLRALIDSLRKVTDAEKDYEFEFVFTDNASTDESFEILSELALTEPRIKALKFSRNFGFQKSILTNYHHARGDAAIQIDADLQDPPEMISFFLREWEKGFKVVYGIRRRRQEFFLINWARNIYYALISSISQSPVPIGAGDFRLIDRTILDHLNNIDEQTPYLRGLIADLGYPQTGIAYDRKKRQGGLSKFGLLSLIELGIDGITAQSIRPLRLMTLTGVIISGTAALMGLYYFVGWVFFFQKVPDGFSTITLLLLALIGLNSFFLGLLGEYVGRIFNNTRGLPFTIIDKKIENGEVKEYK